MNFNSRANEFAADRFAKDLGMGEDLGKGLIKISIGMYLCIYYALMYVLHQLKYLHCTTPTEYENKLKHEYLHCTTPTEYENKLKHEYSFPMYRETMPFLFLLICADLMH
jgi:hypothetical protein